MSFFKMLFKKIQSSVLFFWRRKSKHAFRTTAFTKKTFTPYTQKSAQIQSIFKTVLKKIFLFFKGLKRTSAVGNQPRKNDRRLAFLTICLVVVGLTALVYVGRGWVTGFVSGVEYFEVQDNVVIEGCRVTTPAEIRELGEIRYHTNLFTINLGKLEAILVRHPWVGEVKVHRTWPNRLQIRVVEHVPEALILQGDPGKEQLYYMDTKGVAFVAVKPGQDLDFPVITGIGDIQGADKKKEIISDVIHFLKLVKTNNPNLPAQSISEVHLDKTEGMVVYLVEHPFPIFFGTGGVGKKYKQLHDVLGVLYKQRKEGIQISQVEYIRMEYLTNKVLVAQSGSG
jgi:cell division protein FtsQ